MSLYHKSFVEDLNADSLDLTELIMTLEERFGCEISEADAEKLKTVGDVVNLRQSSEEVNKIRGTEKKNNRIIVWSG